MWIINFFLKPATWVKSAAAAATKSVGDFALFFENKIRFFQKYIENKKINENFTQDF